MHCSLKIGRVGLKLGDIFFYSKTVEHAWLSNFAPCALVIDGERFPNVENYYQSRKATAKEARDKIAGAPTPATAKRLGRTLHSDEMVKDWDAVKFDVMRRALWAKFTQNSEMGRKLLATGDAGLHEDSQNDLVWGVKGQDILGKMLMEVREKLRSHRETEQPASDFQSGQPSEKVKTFIATNKLEDAVKAAEKILTQLQSSFTVRMRQSIFFDPDEWGGSDKETLVFNYQISNLPYSEVLKLWSKTSLEFSEMLPLRERKLTALTMETLEESRH
jgi:ribA/ribD-fused uncharacterized protein